MAEIKIEPKRRSILPWILGLILLALMIFALAAAAEWDARGPADHGTATTWRDDTPPRLRQYALVLGAAAGVPEAASVAA